MAATAGKPSTYAQPDAPGRRYLCAWPKEQASLQNWLESSIRSGKSAFSIIDGPSGCGKTRLVVSLKEDIEDKGGFFIRDSFDRLNTSLPFQSAITEYLNQILKFPIDEVKEIKKQVSENLFGEYFDLLLPCLPNLQDLVSSTDVIQTIGEGQVVSVEEAASRFRFAFYLLLKSLCSWERPLLLFMDNLHWADKQSLDILFDLTASPDIQGLLMVGACRDDEVSSESHLSMILRMMESNDLVSIHEIRLSLMDEDGVGSLVAGFLDLPDQDCPQLSKVLHKRTSGNVHFTIELLMVLFERGAIQARDGSIWWNESEVLAHHQHEGSNKVEDLIHERLNTLPPMVQQQLTLAAIVGSRFDPGLIPPALGMQHSEEPFHEALQLGILQSSNNSVELQFVHDMVRELCIEREADRKQLCLVCGRRLWKYLTKRDGVAEHCEALTQILMKGTELITDRNEKIAQAELFHFTGMKLFKASCFDAAALKLRVGKGLLDERSWQINYRLALEIHVATAEAEQAIGRNQAAEELSREVIENGRALHHKLPAYQF